MSFEMTLHRPKSEWRWMKYQENAKTLIKCIIFQVKRLSFGAFSCNKLYQSSHKWCKLPKPDWSMMGLFPSIKRAWRYILWIGRNKFYENSAIKFPPLCHLPSRRNISTIVTPNHMRLEPMDTRRIYLFKDTKFEEIWVLEDLQTAAQK